MENKRSGKYMRQQSDYSAFIPNPLPPEGNLHFDPEMIFALSRADRHLGRLDGITRTLPNPELFVAMYVRKEALLSSQIEGTQASLIDILDESNDTDADPMAIEEVVNYISAMEFGLRRLDTLPLSLRLLREIHAELLKGVRGHNRQPGQFRASQNWIGPQGCTLSTASFVPPPPHEMERALNDLEVFFHEESDIPPLVKIGLIHAQFETIHPFLDGNGRMGRLLITFYLCQQKILNKPLLYLSYYFKRNREEYYNRLMEIRTNDDWEGWIKFFLNGVAEVSTEAIDSATLILSMQTRYSQAIQEQMPNNANAIRLFNILFEQPFITVNRVKALLVVSYPTANSLISAFEAMGILEKVGNKTRYRKYQFSPYIDILRPGTELR